MNQLHFNGDSPQVDSDPYQEIVSKLTGQLRHRQVDDLLRGDLPQVRDVWKGQGDTGLHACALQAGRIELDKALGVVLNAVHDASRRAGNVGHDGHSAPGDGDAMFHGYVLLGHA